MRARRLLAVLVPAIVAACTAGRDYRRPVVEMPAAWTVESPWRTATPADVDAKGPWWERFDDAVLADLERRALGSSPTLDIAVARLAQARASLDVASASRWPQLALGARSTRARISAERPLSSYTSPNFATVQNDFVATFSATYELDLAGRVQRSIEGAQAGAEQSAADLENTRLVLAADLATAYFNLREADIELDVLDRSIELQRRALELIGARHDLGAASGLEVAQQQAVLDTTLAQVDPLKRQRSAFEHAIATLVGSPAPGFSIAPDLRDVPMPAVPLGVPSDVLERRPDVASAERAMAAANAQIGVATAAFYPSITLGPTTGGETRELSRLFDAPSIVWSVGATLAQPLFDGGRIAANVAYSRAAYDAAVATYRRTVLTAMQEVEDGISGVARMESATQQAQTAVRSARRVLDLASARYEGGASAYLDVITAQQSLVVSERLAAQLRGQRLLASVFLVRSLGGDWQRPAHLLASP
ncbi:MAG TPA: efflux transporter outer membrane subunit [Caldimonas sp.]|nr:efflux transporter outer membrane subunit [Caldimonas sp.]